MQLAWEELPELGVVDDEGHECAEADDTVRVRPEEVVAARVEVGRLDHADREVVDGVQVGREATHLPETEGQEGRLRTRRNGGVEKLHTVYCYIFY